MNARTLPSLAAAAACLLIAGCATGPQYPATYQVPLGPSQVTSDYGPPNLVVNGVQDVPAVPGNLLYYQVVSPVNVIFYAFDKTGSGPGGPLLGQMQGTSFYSSVAPTGNVVEFVFSATQPISSGSVQLTVSNQPLTAGTTAIPYSTPMGGQAGTASQPPVMIAPSNATVQVGQSVTFSASGGAGSGAYVWGGAASASGTSNMYTFNAPGTYTVTVYRTGDMSYAQSNTASATINVSPPLNQQPNYVNPAVSVTPVR